MKMLKIYDGAEPAEDVVDPDIAIIDAHHHLWSPECPIATYEAADIGADIAASGHKVVGTVFVEAMGSYREGGDEALRPVGETDYVVASAKKDKPFVAAGIVGWADLRNPKSAARTLDAHIAAGEGRFSGVRHNVVWHEREDLFPASPRKFPRHLLLDQTFRDGLREVARRGLAYDVWMYSDQLADLVATADVVADLTIVLDHCGGPVAPQATPEEKRQIFERWRTGLKQVAQRPNVYLKVGGMGTAGFGFPYAQFPERPRGPEIAALWQPYFDVAVEAFGPSRCMFESNFPPDKNTYSYRAFWNALKILSRGYSADERAQMFAGTATKVYKLKLDLPR